MPPLKRLFEVCKFVLLCFALMLVNGFSESPYSYRDSDAQDLSGQIRKQSEWAQAHGGFADIWRAQWEPEGGASFPVRIFSCFCFVH
jgi:hypothetical protein